jgi:hypothetical protein
MDIKKLLQSPGKERHNDDRIRTIEDGSEAGGKSLEELGEVKPVTPPKVLPRTASPTGSRGEGSGPSTAPSLVSGNSATLSSQSPKTPPQQAGGSSASFVSSNYDTHHDHSPQRTGYTTYYDDAEAQEDLEAVVQAEEGGSIVVDSDDTSTDAGYETDSRTSGSTSLASSVRDYAFENGRRYHKFREGRYAFPNDDVEQEREDMKHAMVKMLCQQLHFAPIGDHPQQILDIGTGTGIWAIESE